MNQNIKKNIKHLIIKGLKYSGITKLFYILNRNRKKIICYHNIIPDKYFSDNINLDYAIKESNFRSHMDIITKKFNIGLDLYDSSKITITFDDGYLNQYLLGSKILDEYNINGYFFYCASLLDKQDTLLIDKIQYWIDYVKPGKYNNKKYKLNLDISDKQSRRIEIKKINQLLENKISIEEVCNLLDEMYKFDSIELPKEFYTLRFTPINKINLEDMKKNGHKIGAHSSLHKALSDLTEEELEEDISKCRSLLDNGIYNTKTFCYPFGSEIEVSNKVMEKVKEKGFKNALSFVNDDFKRNNNNYFIPRMSLPDTNDEYLIDFILSGTCYFMHNYKLFPKVKLENDMEYDYE